MKHISTSIKFIKHYRAQKKIHNLCFKANLQLSALQVLVSVYTEEDPEIHNNNEV
jgi:hypothetical protein